MPPTTAPEPAPEELPLIHTQEEYDKLPIGARFRHSDGYVYRKASESSAEESQKMQRGGVVTPPTPVGEQPEQPEQPEMGGSAPPQDTDTVPAKLTPGEYVVPKPAVDQLGVSTLDALSGVSNNPPYSPLPPAPIAPGGAGSGRGSGGGSAGGKSDVHGQVYEQYGWEGHAANFGPHGNRLGEGYGVGLGVDKQKEVGAKFGDWVRIDFANGTSEIRQVNETSERPNGVEFFTNREGTYNNRGKATVTKISAPA